MQLAEIMRRSTWREPASVASAALSLLRRARGAAQPSHRDYDRSGLSAKFEQDGVVFLPALFDPTFISQINAEAERIYNLREEKARRLLITKGLLTQDQWRSIAVANIKLNRKPLLAQLMHHVFLELARSYLGKEPVPHADSYVRSQLPAHRHTHLPFHQDQTVVGSRLVNIWIPLVACGRDAPGLEVVAGSWDQLVPPADPSGPGHIVERARIDETAVLAAYPTEAMLRPEFSVGDAIVFSGATIHRTHIAPGMNRARTSIDMRLV